MTDFYQAGTFWVTVAGVALSSAVGSLAALIALKSAPKRRLSYGMSDSVPLLTADGAQHGLEVRRGGQQLTDPRLVEVTLQSSGRQSINSKLFDQGKPLKVDFGTPIVDLLKVTSRPAEQAIPDYKQSGSALDIGPSVLAPRQWIKFFVLVDGQPDLKLVSHLSDVRIRRQPTGPEQRARRISYAALVAAIVAFAIFIGYSRITAPKPTASSALIHGLLGLPAFGKSEKIAYNMLPRFGLNPKTQYRCLAYLWNNQSGWHYWARNLSTGSKPANSAYGIPQVLPGSRMASAGRDWRTNPATQIKWGLRYITTNHNYKTPTPCGAWNYFRTHGFY